VTWKARAAAELDPNTHPTGVKVTVAEIARVNLQRHDFHSDWNYAIMPSRPP
jgi:hypothetical protein